MDRLKNKVAIITGGAKGLGEADARLFVEEGAKVVIADVDVAAGKKLADELGENALFCKLDVSQKSDWDKVIETAEKAFGYVNVLVNNAGIGIIKPLIGYPLEDYMKTVQVNQLGCLLGMQAVVPSMQKAGMGSIVNMSSQAGLKGAPGGIAYCASKFAITGMTKSAALELAPLNIRVTSVHPSTASTDLLKQDDHKDLLDMFLESIPQKRFAAPREISQLVLFLASDDASFCTGGQYLADGGSMAG